LQYLVNNTLTGNRGIAMDENRNNFTGVVLVSGINLSPGDALNNRVNSFKVRRVGSKG
jgi:hypothetical protein